MTTVTTKKAFKIECGTVQGIVAARSAGSAFRKIMKSGFTKDDWGVLARFKSGRLNTQFKFYNSTDPWFYQSPEALEKAP